MKFYRTKDIFKKISARSLTLPIYAVVWVVCSRRQCGRGSTLQLLLLSAISVFSLSKFYLLPGNVLIKHYSSHFSLTSIQWNVYHQW